MVVKQHQLLPMHERQPLPIESSAAATAPTVKKRVLQLGALGTLAWVAVFSAVQAAVAAYVLAVGSIGLFLGTCVVASTAMWISGSGYTSALTMTGTAGGRDLGISRARGLCMLFVMVIHCACESDLDELLLHRRVVNRAVPVLVFLMGATAVHSDHRQFSWAVARVCKMLPAMWSFLLLVWSYRLTANVWINFTLYVSHGKARPWLLVGASFFAYAPCIGGAWFFTLAVQIYLLLVLVGRLGRDYPVLLALSACCEIAEEPIVAAVRQVFSNETLRTCDLNGLLYWMLFLPRSVPLVIAGMWYGTFRSRMARSPLAIRLAAGITFILSAACVEGDYHSLDGDATRRLALLSSDAALALLLVEALRLLPPSSISRGMQWVGDHSWTIYLGHLLVLNLGVKFPSACDFEWWLPTHGGSFAFVALSMLVGVLFSVANDRLSA